ncbi:hypothetical protein ABZ636_36900 [Streptomyces sp. NPDC007251]|uniref:hypothetical protein n=1 Tax=Streptomyces sp. NPDC007251 TaxID=3154483 RepID=UPI0033BFD87A
MLPDTGSVQRWATSDPATDEVLRIWYVAVTRARRLAAIALPEEETDALAHLLAERRVPVRIVCPLFHLRHRSGVGGSKPRRTASGAVVR